MAQQERWSAAARSRRCGGSERTLPALPLWRDPRRSKTRHYSAHIQLVREDRAMRKEPQIERARRYLASSMVTVTGHTTAENEPMECSSSSCVKLSLSSAAWYVRSCGGSSCSRTSSSTMSVAAEHSASPFRGERRIFTCCEQGRGSAKKRNLRATFRPPPPT